ncbi:MAG: hypothetical protein OXC48_06355 [Endozoicomonadaceae bacterium]|nr:hypothetical protein [Endozoicomonadaceae bacterium]
MSKQLTDSESQEKKNTQAIADQIEKFLRSGGKIQRIPSGVSGRSNLSYKRLMTISEKASVAD